MSQEVVDGHRLEALLGEAGLVQDHLAAVREVGGERPLRLRRILLPTPPSKAALAALEQELAALEKSPHEGILVPLRTGLHHSQPYLLTEPPPGASLRALLDAEGGGALPPPLVRRIGIDLAQALAHLHGGSPALLHRSLSPDQVQVDRKGRALLDGPPIGALLHAAGAQVAQSMGPACAYLSPEQVKRSPLSPKADVFALGCTLYEALTGKGPFAAPTAVGITIKISMGQLTPLDRALGAPLTELIERMLATDPGARPSASEVATALLAIPEEGDPRLGLTKRVKAIAGEEAAVIEEVLDQRATVQGNLDAGRLEEARAALRAKKEGATDVGASASLGASSGVPTSAPPVGLTSVEEDARATVARSGLDSARLEEARASLRASIASPAPSSAPSLDGDLDQRATLEGSLDPVRLEEARAQRRSGAPAPSTGAGGEHDFEDRATFQRPSMELDAQRLAEARARRKSGVPEAPLRESSPPGSRPSGGIRPTEPPAQAASRAPLAPSPAVAGEEAPMVVWIALAALVFLFILGIIVAVLLA